MKTLVLLFACLAAANALSFAVPPCYRTWSITKYCVFPVQEFRFQVHFCGSWMTTKYYADILKVYPDANCKEMTRDEFRSDCAGKLSARLRTIYYAMNSHFSQWKTSLKAIVDKAKATYYSSVTAYCTAYVRYVWDCSARDRYIALKVEAINDYNTRIDEMYRNACSSYAKALNESYRRIYDFHVQILDRSVKAYDTRLEKIKEFDRSLYSRMSQYLSTFKSTMAKLIEKKADAYRNLLYKVHCGNYWQRDNVNYVVNLYRSKQYSQCWRDASAYWSRLMSIRAQMMRSFRCNYRIITYSGVCSLARKEYNTFCQSLGTWWSFKISRTIPCFRYVHYQFSWKATEYKNLITCDLNAVNQTVDDFKKAMEAKGRDALSAAARVFGQWKSTWVGYHIQYYNKYVQIVVDRHNFLCRYYEAQIYCRFGGFCTYYTSQFAAFKAQLEERKNKAIAEYRDMLWQRIVQACNTYSTRVAEYRKMVDGLVAKVVAGYSACLDTRAAKIAEYQKKQIEVRNKMRSALYTKLYKIYSLKCQQYYDMMMFYHAGQKLCGRPYSLWGAYKGKIYYEMCHYLHLFDNHWRTLLPKLVMHYSCGYKCTYGAKFTIPQLHCSFYNWVYTLPHTSCYTYELACYNKYYNYRLIQCGCNYYYRLA